MFHSVGSHVPEINLDMQAEAFEYTFPNYTKQAKCYVGVDVTQVFPEYCPKKFGDRNALLRNPWRISATNRHARHSYHENHAVVAGIGKLSLSALDVATHMDDCVHFAMNKPFNVYDEALKLIIAAAGRDCD